MHARLLLVHSPLVGCGTWEPVARDLAGDGYAVTVPDLAGAVAAGPTYHLRQARVIAGSAAGRAVILIGHSRAGPLLATAGTMLGEAVRGYVFVDARLPSPGRSWMETVAPGLAARRAGCRRGRGGGARRNWLRLSPTRLPGGISLPGVPGCRWPCWRKFTRPRLGGRTLLVAISSSARPTKARRPERANSAGR